MTTTLEPTARLSSEPDVFGEIRNEDCHLAVWRRPSNPELAKLLDAPLIDARFSAPLSALNRRLEDELSASGYADVSARAALIEDIVALAHRFGAVMDLDEVSVRLAIVTTDSCRKFHADYVKTRLITTYVGTGTQWVGTEDAARIAREEEPRDIRTFATGDVGLFKGKMWSQSPIIHRSPPIGKTGETRLVLVLDPPHAA